MRKVGFEAKAFNAVVLRFGERILLSSQRNDSAPAFIRLHEARMNSGGAYQAISSIDCIFHKFVFKARLPIRWTTDNKWLVIDFLVADGMGIEDFELVTVRWASEC